MCRPCSIARGHGAQSFLKTFSSADRFSDGSATLCCTQPALRVFGLAGTPDSPPLPQPPRLILKGLAKQCSALILAPAMSMSLIHCHIRRRCLNHSSWGKPLRGPILARPSGYGMRYILRQCCLPHEASPRQKWLVCVWSHLPRKPVLLLLLKANDTITSFGRATLFASFLDGLQKG